MLLFFFLMIRRPPRSTLDRSSAASDVYKRQLQHLGVGVGDLGADVRVEELLLDCGVPRQLFDDAVSYTHLRAHETVLDLVCRLLLEKKNTHTTTYNLTTVYTNNIHYNT